MSNGKRVFAAAWVAFALGGLGFGQSIRADGEAGRVLPFSRLAIGVKAGTLGFGVEVATPLVARLNLRGGGNFVNVSGGLGVDGANYSGTIQMRSGQVALDWFPFRRGLRFSPGLLIFKSQVSAAVDVPGGKSFDLGSGTYQSSATDPVHGDGSVTFGRSIMPAFTFGFGNIIARDGGHHWSVPFEAGLAYSGSNMMQLRLVGTACSAGQCQSTADPSVQQNVVAEQNDINETMKRFKVIPILTTGLAYRF